MAMMMYKLTPPLLAFFTAGAGLLESTLGLAGPSGGAVSVRNVKVCLYVSADSECSTQTAEKSTLNEAKLR